mgnify:CR=1 FL=1
MKYDFTSIMDRHGKDATAIDGLGSMPGFTPDPVSYTHLRAHET